MEQSEYYALRVALQTMKERCVSLQKRLSTVEDENQELRERFDEQAATIILSSYGSNNGAVENMQLRMQVSELLNQKNQLNEHISMISNENRKLWSRLSQISKEQDGKVNSQESMSNTLLNGTQVITQCINGDNNGTSANQNLIRSKTFTQHSPNPNLRHKVVQIEEANDMKCISFEDQTLEVDEENSKNYIEGGGESFADASEAELAFAYLNDDSNDPDDSDSDFSIESKKCIEAIQEMRIEAMKQQEDLNRAASIINKRISLQPCSQCALKPIKPEMADKSLETDESLNEIKFTRYKNISSDTELNILEMKVPPDSLDKICPMCGKIYTSNISFDDFKEHVELHFIDDSIDSEESMERNYEMVSQIVGDF